MLTTGFDGFELAHFRQPGGGMAMQMQRQIDRIFKRFDQFAGRIRRQQPGHVFNRDGVATQSAKFFAQSDKTGTSCTGLVV